MEVKIIRSRRRRRFVGARLVNDLLLINAPLVLSQERLDKIIGDFKLKFARRKLKTELDKEKNAALLAAGLTEDTKQQTLKDDIAEIDTELQTETDATKIAAEKKQKIIDEYEIKKQDALDASAKKQAEIEQELSDVKIQIQIAQAKIDMVSAANAFKNDIKLGNKDAVAAAAASDANYNNLISLLQESLTIPQAAEGAVVSPTPGGTLMNIGEGGKTEVVFPLDKLNQFINTGSTSGSGSSGGMVNLSIQLDSKTLYSGIFQATKNKTVLISASSVV